MLSETVMRRRLMLACAERELAKRQSVYPRLIAKGTMTPDKANREITVMGWIVDEIRVLLSPTDPSQTILIEQIDMMGVNDEDL